LNADDRRPTRAPAAKPGLYFPAAISAAEQLAGTAVREVEVVVPCRLLVPGGRPHVTGADEAFLELAARSGCKQLFIGLESISQPSLNAVHKGFNRVAEYSRVIERVHSYGIAIQAGIVFGFDEDTDTVFAETLDFLEATGVQNATFNILTPYPGTQLYERLKAEGRIVTYDWSKYNGRVVFEPRQMSRETLLEGYRYAHRRFYSGKSIYRRLSRSSAGWWWSLPLNTAYAMALWRSQRLEGSRRGYLTGGHRCNAVP
jgi:radical SAM superfamily enzyme YgiQ (UPF0313 family)